MHIIKKYTHNKDYYYMATLDNILLLHTHRLFTVEAHLLPTCSIGAFHFGLGTINESTSTLHNHSNSSTPDAI